MSYQHGEAYQLYRHLKRQFQSRHNLEDKFEYSIAPDELLEIFVSYAPDKRSSFQQIIETEEQTCRQSIQGTQALLEQLNKPDAEESEAVEEEGLPEEILAAPQAQLPGAAYILDQVEEQRERFPATDDMVTLTGQKLHEIVQANAEFLQSVDPRFYVEGINRASYKNGITLRESAWAQIDAEQNIEILKRLLMLTILSERESTFWRWRIHLLEHKELWPQLLVNVTESNRPKTRRKRK